MYNYIFSFFASPTLDIHLTMDIEGPLYIFQIHRSHLSVNRKLKAIQTMQLRKIR